MYLSQTNGPVLYYFNGNVTKSVEHLSKAGFKYFDISFFSCFKKGSIYFSDDYMKIVDEYKEAIKKYNMTPVQAHEPAGNSIGDDGGEYYMKKTPRSIEMAAKIGSPSITIHPGTRNTFDMSKEEFVEGNVKAIKKLIPYAEEYGIDLLLENIGYMQTPPFKGVHASTAQDLIDIVDEINHPLVNVNWDVGHANFNGLNEYEEMVKLGTRLHGIHVHDNLGFKDITNSFNRTVQGDMHTMPLYHNVDFDGVIKALIDVNYKGTFNFEVDAPKGVMTYTNNDEKLVELARDVRLKCDTLLYSVGKLLLEKYNLYEE